MIDRYRGTILGQAVADAVGRLCRPGRPIPYSRTWRKGDLLSPSLGTQLMLATARGMINSSHFLSEGYLPGVVESVHRTEMGWFTDTAIVWPPLRLRDLPHLDSESGCLMRAAPIGMALAGDPNRAFELGAAMAAAASGTASAATASGLLAAIVARALIGEDLVDSMRQELACRDIPETTKRLFLANSGSAVSEVRSWSADNILRTALYCAVTSQQSFETAIIMASTQQSDSIASAAVTGAVLGAVNGESCIPSRWVESLKERDLFSSVATSLYRVYREAESAT